MTFEQFETAVKTNRPDIYAVYPHEVKRRHGVKVGVQFVDGGKIYSFGGTYIQVLRNLDIDAITTSEIRELEEQLKLAIQRHGLTNMFSGKPVDTTEEQRRLASLLSDYRQKYVIDAQLDLKNEK